MSNFKISVFGCWNEGCNENSGQQNVSKLIKANESKYKFMVILGDNYYAKKVTLSNNPPIKIKDTNVQELINGFKCLENINLEKKLIMGNHDIEDSMDKSCSALKIQLKLPMYDVKFPFGYDLYYLYHYENKNKNAYETVLFIYLDTSLYDENLNDTNSCYKSSLNINIDKLREDQEIFLLKTLDMINDKIYNIKNVVFFAHEPLITFKNKNDVNTCSIKSSLLKTLFDVKIKYDDKEFYWICADYHIYQNAIITHKLKPGQKITQWIFGTGGGELDKVPTINTHTVEQYKLEILQNVIFNSDDVDISSQFNTFGIAKHGYGEIIFDFCSITHKFISIDNTVNNNIYKTKYLKYKTKYNELKKLNNKY